MNKFKVGDKVKLARPPEEDPYFIPARKSVVSFDETYIVAFVDEDWIRIEKLGGIFSRLGWHPDTFKKVKDIFIKSTKVIRY